LDFGENYEEEMEETFRKVGKCNRCGQEWRLIEMSTLGDPHDTHFYCDSCYAMLTDFVALPLTEDFFEISS
jgi:hypothetical protein